MPRQSQARESAFTSETVEEIGVFMVHREAALMPTNDEQLDIRYWKKKISVGFLGFEQKIGGIQI